MHMIVTRPSLTGNRSQTTEIAIGTEYSGSDCGRESVHVLSVMTCSACSSGSRFVGCLAVYSSFSFLGESTRTTRGKTASYLLAAPICSPDEFWRAASMAEDNDDPVRSPQKSQRKPRVALESPRAKLSHHSAVKSGAMTLTLLVSTRSLAMSLAAAAAACVAC
jgi:hypothetical protein